MNRHVCLEAHNNSLAYFWQLFNIFATPNIDLVVSIVHKICSVQKIDPNKYPMPLFNMATCIQSMQRTWWPVVSTSIVTGSYWNRPISQIPQCTSPISHNASFCNRNVHTCAHFCYKMVHCGIFDWCIVGFVRWVYYAVGIFSLAGYM